ncbi:aminodeoxychorismate synthase component I [Lewinella sp. 4G2]|nr:aminodeoxychorismate synthase component I [Lewinella sp. 4G2]
MDYWAKELDRLGALGTPCFFLVDFEQKGPRIWTLDDPQLPEFHFPGSPAKPSEADNRIRPRLYAEPPSMEEFRRAFDVVQTGLKRGDSFLTNLTFPIPIQLNCGLADVYHAAQAKYRIYLPEEFTCFSPETFVTVSAEGTIESRPMKGTALDNEKDRNDLLKSEKEIAEHATIVDLIRNDLSMVASRVRVTDYRYFHKISTSRRGLVQTSSNISGQLPVNWRTKLGSTIAKLLPAGSISGAPKPATLNIIRRAELQERGYYCGIGGYFDGRTLDTCVLIRLIEKREDGTFFFRSGGGITARSRWEDEFNELKAKVRIPVAEEVFPDN